jgi:hypothetical protein
MLTTKTRGKKQSGKRSTVTAKIASPEGSKSAYDEQWNDICSAMAYIQEELGIPEIADNEETDLREIPGAADNTDVESVDVGNFNVCFDVMDGNLQIRVYPRDQKGQLWDHPCDTFDVEQQQVETGSANHAHDERRARGIRRRSRR